MIPLLLFLLGAAAVYIGTIEAAFSALMRFSLRLAAERSDQDDTLARYLADPIRLFVPARLLLGLIFALASVLIATRTGTSSRGIGVLLLSVAGFILICEHFLPLLIARRDPERTLEVAIGPFDVVARFLQPITNLLVGMLRRERRERAPDAPDDQPEVKADANQPETAEQRHESEREERRLLQSIVDFGDTLVREVMTPRPDIVAIRADSTVAQLRALFREQEYSRIPVYAENLDNILGFVFVKDLIQHSEAEAGASIAPLVRPATFVPETKRVSELLREFQRGQVQSAIVVDEYGGTAGLVTLEDLLEEIVGEIRDEYDVETEPIVEEGHGSWIFSAKVNIDEVADRLGLEIESRGFETVGGYVLARLGRVPAVGETLEIDDLTVEVLEAERRRVHRVRMRRSQAVENGDGSLFS